MTQPTARPVRDAVIGSVAILLLVLLLEWLFDQPYYESQNLKWHRIGYAVAGAVVGFLIILRFHPTSWYRRMCAAAFSAWLAVGIIPLIKLVWINGADQRFEFLIDSASAPVNGIYAAVFLCTLLISLIAEGRISLPSFAPLRLRDSRDPSGLASGRSSSTQSAEWSLSPSEISEVRACVAKDDLLGAVELLQQVSNGQAPEVQDDAVQLQRRLSNLMQQDRSKVIEPSKLEVELQRLTQDILFRVRLLPPPAVSMTKEPLTQVEKTVLTGYLADLKLALQNRLDEACIVDLAGRNIALSPLRIVDSPQTVFIRYLPNNPHAPRPLRNVKHARKIYRNRLLILGSPGAGKSTVLRQVALEFVNAAIADENAPIPFRIDLAAPSFNVGRGHRWANRLLRREEPTEDDCRKQFMSQLLDEMARFPGITRSLASKWLNQRRIAFFLDGLDEVGRERGRQLIKLLNDTILWDSSDTPVLICSRANEYQALHQDSGSRLSLRGAITLQPLEILEVDRVLLAAGAHGVRRALELDATLRDLAQTPLTLNMMALAYHDSSASDIRLGDSLNNQRFRLLAAYVRRLQSRYEFRLQRITGPQILEASVAEYRYPPNSLDAYLNWIALRMSVRSQHSIPRAKFYSFLATLQDGRRNTLDLLMTRAASGFLLVALTPLAIFFAPRTLVGGLTASACLIVAYVLNVCWKSVAGLIPRSKEWIEFLALFGTGMLSMACIARAATELVKIGVAPLAMGLIVLTSGVGILLIPLTIAKGRQDRRVARWISASTLLAFSVGIGAEWLLDGMTKPGEVLALILIGTQAVCVSALVYLDGDLPRWAIPAVAIGWLGGCTLLQWASLWMVPSLSWLPALLLVVIWTWLFIQSGRTAAALLLSAAATVGAFAAGPAGAVTSSVVTFLGWATWSNLEDSGLPSGLTNWMKVRKTHVSDTIERYFLSPGLYLVAAASRCVPFRSRRFCAYCAGAALLKPTTDEIQFAHPRLREYYALTAVLPTFNDPKRKEFTDAIVFLPQLGDSAIDLLTEIVHTGTTEQRALAFKSLSLIPSADVVPVLERGLTEQQQSIKCEIVRSIVAIPRESRERLWKQITQDNDPVIGLTAMEVAASFIEPTAMAEFIESTLMQHPHHFDYLAKVVELVQRGSLSPWSVARVLPPWTKEYLQQIVVDRSGNCTGALKLLGYRAEFAELNSLVAVLTNDKDASIRAAAANALGSLKDSLAVETLIGALVDPAPTVRAAAARALGLLLDERSVDPLINRLRDRSELVRAAAANSLGAHGNPKAEALLLRTLKDRNKFVRRAAAKSLGLVGAAAAAKPLMRSLRDRDAWVRKEAAQALGKLKANSAVPILCRALHDNERSVRIAVAEALAEIGDTDAVNPLRRALAESDSNAKTTIIRALGQLGDGRAVYDLIPLLQDPDHYVRWFSASALGDLKHSAAVQPLLNVLRDPNSDIRVVAVRSLREIGDVRALPGLREVVNERDEKVRYAVEYTIMQLERDS